MSASITVNSDHPQFSAVIALLMGSASPAALAAPNAAPTSTPSNGPGFPPMPTATTPGAPAPVSADDDADDSGPVNTNAPAVDSTGLPWDERIHASTKTTKADGTWTGRRGGPKGAKLDAIVAELRSRAAPPMPTQQPVAQPAPAPIPPMPANPEGIPTSPVMMQPVPMQGMAPPPVMQPAPMPVPAPMPTPQPVAQPAPTPQATGPLDFGQFMQHLSEQMKKRDPAGAPLVHTDYLAQITAEISNAFAPHGHQPLSAITDIATDPNKINYAVQLMTRDGRW